MRTISRLLLRLSGWELDDRLPKASSYVIIGYPHTSNWDFVLGMLARWSLDLPLNWVAKHSIFWGPFRPLLLSMGGVPLNRKTTHGFIERYIELFEQRDSLIIGIMPEGTRSKVDRWKTGFYYIAHGANVPIALAYFDYKNKKYGVGKTIEPSGDIHADFEVIKQFYLGKTGCNPELMGDMRIEVHEEFEKDDAKTGA